MKKKLAESLRHMQSHPTTGTPHNQQVISTQVETIFMLDELNKKIVKLNKTIKESDKQSKKLEMSNYRLQWATLILTFIATVIVAYPVLSSVVNWLSSYLGQLLNFEPALQLTAVVAGFLSAIIGFITTAYGKKYYEKKITETVSIKDSVNIVVKDKKGNIKEAFRSD